MKCTPDLQQYGHHCLPHTGLDLSWVAMLAVLAILVGTTLVIIARGARTR